MIQYQPTDRRFVIGLCAWTLRKTGQDVNFRNIRSTIRLLQRGFLYVATWRGEDGEELFQIRLNPTVVDCLETRVLH